MSDVEALADAGRATKTQTKTGCEMEAALVLIAIIVSLADTSGGKAGW